MKRLLPADPPTPAAAPLTPAAHLLLAKWSCREEGRGSHSGGGAEVTLGGAGDPGRRGGGGVTPGRGAEGPGSLLGPPVSWRPSPFLALQCSHGLPSGGGTGAERPGAIGPCFSPSPVPLCFLTFASFSSSFQKWLRDPSVVSLSHQRCRPLMARGCLPGNCAPGSRVPTLPGGRPGSSVSGLRPAWSGAPCAVDIPGSQGRWSCSSGQRSCFS